MHKALDQCEKTVKRFQKRGLSVLTVFIGIINIPMTLFIIGKYPEKYFLL